MEIIAFRTENAVMLISCCRDLEDWERGSLTQQRFLYSGEIWFGRDGE